MFKNVGISYRVIKYNAKNVNTSEIMLHTNDIY